MKRIAIVVLVALLASVAAAGPEPRDSPRAEALIAEGRALEKAGDYAAACEKYNDVIAETPSSVTAMLGLGSCHEQRGKTATALNWYRRARAFSRDHQLTSSEDKAKARVDDLEARVPIAKIAFGGARPDDVKVAIDDYPVPPNDYKKVELDPGPHVIDVIAPGYEPFHKEFDVEDSSKRTIVVSLVATGGSSSSPGVVDKQRSAPMHPRRAKGLIFAGIGGLALGAGGGIAWYAYRKYDECVDDGVAVATCHGQDGLTAANHYRSIARWGATPLVLGGAALIGVGAYLYFTTPAGATTGVAWAPVITADQLGITAVGRF